MQLKEDLEKLNIKRSQASIVTLDIEAMYPSIQIEHVKRAIEYFLRDASEEDKVKADSCLEMIRFGMANTMSHVTRLSSRNTPGQTEVEADDANRTKVELMSHKKPESHRKESTNIRRPISKYDGIFGALPPSHSYLINRSI